MRTTLLAIVVLAVVAVAPAAARQGATTTVSITRTAFVPRTVTVTVGETVQWTNRDTVNHQVSSQGANFVSPVLKPGQSYSFTFMKAGRFAYQDPLRNLHGIVAAAAPTASATLTLTSDPQPVTYGRAATLSGVLSSHDAGQTVAIRAQACGETASTPLLSVTTTAGGAWSATVKPLKNTSYQAKAQNSNAAVLAEKVRPRLTLSKAGRHRFRVRVSAAQSFSGKVAVFQRYKPFTGAWVRVRYVTLRTLATGSPTTLSGATFRSAIKKRQRVRIVLGPSQAGGCYTTGVSGSIRS